MDGTDEGKLSSSWVYIKEGNSSFVIGHKTKHIICRLWKVDAKNQEEGDSREAECQTKIAFIKNVLQPLLGHFVNVPKCLPVTPAFIESVREAFKGQRPVKRLDKVLDQKQRHVLSQPNFCFLENSGAATRETISVEIKPKLGYIPLDHYISSGNEINREVCLFCMQQSIKKKTGMWDYTSQYCPVNLFSGNHRRTRNALESLFSTPQNNLCVFKDGEKIYPGDGTALPTEEEQEAVAMAIHGWLAEADGPPFPGVAPGQMAKSSSIQDLITMLLEALCKPDKTTTQSKNGESLSAPWQPCLVGAMKTQEHVGEERQYELPEGCVLHRILATQRLDTQGIEVIHSVYQRYLAYAQEHPEERDCLSPDGPFTRAYLQPHPCTTPTPTHCTPADTPGLTPEECVALLRGYVVSRTARDCSIMVTLQPADDQDIGCEEEEVISLRGKRFRYACRLIDLDFKTPMKIPYYHRFEQLITDTYLNR